MTKKIKKNKKSSDLKNYVSKVLAGNPKKRYTPKQLKRKMKVSNSVDAVAHVLAELEKSGVAFQVKDGRYKWNKRMGETSHKSNTPSKDRIERRSPNHKKFEGKVDLTRSGAAYIIVEELEDDIYVAPKYTGGVMQRDIVEVELFTNNRRRRPEGKITRVIKRSLTHVIGKIEKYKKFALVKPISNNFIPDIQINYKDLPAEVENDQHVVVEIISWGSSQNKALWGRVSKVLEEASHNDLTMQSILLSHGFELEFPPAVLKETEFMSSRITESEVEKRRDFRGIHTFTIDPLTARDFDDALSLEWSEDKSTFEVGIHIADVTHYVKPGTALDVEAFERSTSVYLVDRVLPMLPEKLSNELCSLVPNEDRYTFSAAFTFDKDFKIIKQWFGKSIIHSDRRFTYEEAQAIIEGADGDYKADILHLNTVAEHLRKARFKNGAINFESDEILFELDEDAVPIKAYTKERKAAHMLVEDFMLLANKNVALFISKIKGPEVPFVYRIHDEPNPDKLADFSLFAKELGVTIKTDSPRQIARSLNQLADKAKEDPALKMLEPLAIRTMSKAVYSSENIGHYGLSFDFYTHFTSPIRRYSDVLVHRILQENLTGVKRVDKEKLEARCKHISAQEKKAAEAERASKKYKQAEYISRHIGEVFDGRISGMIDKGIFVELVESHAEGLIPFSRLGENYQIADSKLKASSRKSGNVFTMGDEVKVRILSVDLDDRLIEMDLVEEN